MLKYEEQVDGAQEMSNAAEVCPSDPADPTDVKLTAADNVLEVRARVGKVSPALAVVFLLSSLWAAKWLTELAALLNRLNGGNVANPGPELFVFAVMGFGGVYCAVLMLWIMLGSERLTIRDGRLHHSNLWLFGLQIRGYPVESVGPFQALSKDCGAEADGCCCRVTTVDYTLTFGHNGRRISIFSHLPRASKDWLQDRLNAALAQARDSGSR
jgi:hypothetical protein